MVAERMEQPPATTVGTMTGAANEVEEHLAKLRLPPRVTSFTNWMKRHTFGNAGFHAQSRRDASWCYFYREDVMQYTELSKFEVLHARKWLEDARIIFYDTNIPRSADPRAKNPDGRVTWNLNYSQWNAPMPKARGGARAGAGNPNWKKQQAAIAQIERAQAAIAQIESKTAAEPFQKMQSQLDSTLSKNAMAASFGSTTGVSAPGPVIKVTEEEITEERVPNGTEAVASAPSLSGPSNSHGLQEAQNTSRLSEEASIAPLQAQQAAMFASEAKSETPAAPPARPKRASKTGVTQEQIDALWAAWEPCGPHVIQRSNIGRREWSRHASAMTDLVLDGITPEMIPALIAAKHEAWKWKKDPYILKPGDISGDLATLRPMISGAVVVTAQNNGQAQKGANQNGQQQRAGANGNGDRVGRGYNDATQAALNRLRAKREADQQRTASE